MEGMRQRDRERGKSNVKHCKYYLPTTPPYVLIAVTLLVSYRVI